MKQRLTLVGNLGNDPEYKELRDDYGVTNFSLATNRTRKDRDTGEKITETTWFRVAVFGAQAPACAKYLSKGRQVMVEGRLKADPTTGGPVTWERQDGTIGASFEVIADDVTFLGGGEAQERAKADEKDPWD
jgi:single-strand DNA-binding protein